jgi:predicted metal-dependent peptidase
MSDEQKNQQKIKWDSAMLSAAEAAKGKGELPAGLERGLSNIKNPQKDWRILLQEFIQEEYNDYSLMPPDKRFESEFFMFDFNDTIEVVNDILFFVDTSGSMGETAVNMCFSEIQGAINQFEKHLHGELFFFDADVAKKHYNFDDVNGNVAGLTVFGGGGTSYHCVFDYVRKHREDFNQINGIIILTDGYCDYPDEEMTDGIPVLWIYTTPEVGREKNPFGRSAILDESMFEEN